MEMFLVTIFLVYHNVAFPFTLKNIIKQKKNYENSNISPRKNIILKNNPLKKTKLLQDVTTLSLIPSFNTSQNIIFQKS
jgi:N-methylhydantoinase B/oxoprolinase/acetone carboxylase alpha subunit